MSDLSAYCQALLREGEKESSGRFTIDYARARSNLSQHLFGDPSNYLLKFVQHAVAQNAANILVQTRRQDMQISFQGRALLAEDIHHLKDLLVEPSQAVGSRWRDLILSLYAAQSLDPDFLVYASITPQKGVGLLLHHNRADVIDLPGGPDAQLLLLRRTSRDSFWRRLFYSPRHISQDCHALATRCRHSWVPILLDNRTVAPSLVQFKRGNLAERVYLSRSQPEHLLSMPPFHERPALMYDLSGRTQNVDTVGKTVLHQWRSYASHDKGLPLFEVTYPPSTTPEVREGLLSDLVSAPAGRIVLYRGSHRTYSAMREQNSLIVTAGTEGFSSSIFSHKGWFTSATPYPAAQAVMVCPSQPTRDESQLLICHKGVLLEPVAINLPLKDVRVVVADSQAQTDLTGLQVVRDERFQTLCEWVSKEAGKLRDEVRRVLRFHDNIGLSESFVKQVNQWHGLGL